jgi:hypothetical protein
MAMEVKLDTETILNYEFLHDNKSDKKILTNTNVFDMIERKMIMCKKIKSNPEVIMKESLFKNILYGNISITDIAYTDTLVKLDTMKLKNNIFLVFDNKQLTISNIEILNIIFENKNIVIFVPFIFLAEYLLNDKVTLKTIKEVKQKFIEDFKDIKNSKNEPVPILFDNYFMEDNMTLNDFYKKECEDIGLYYDGTQDQLINFNIFSNKNFEKTNNLSTNQIQKFMEEIKKVRKYIDNFNYDKENNEFYNKMKDIKTDFYKYFVDSSNNQIKKIHKIDKDLFIKIKNIRIFIMSLKESRDTQYYNEIKKYIRQNIIYENYQIFYITMDEISNIRCVLNKMSTINIYNGIPRYIISIYQNYIIFKHFNIFHKLVDETTNTNIKLQVEKTRKFNLNLISNSGKSLFLKKYKIETEIAGGFINKYEKIDNNTVKILDDYQNIIYLMPKIKRVIHETKVETIEDIINKRDYKKIEKFIFEIDIFFSDSYRFIFNDIIKSVQEITKNNKIYLDKIKEMREIFKNLKYLFNTIPYMELLENVYIEGYSNNLDTNFKNELTEIFGKKYESYLRHFHKEIPKEKWDGIFIAWLFFDRCIFPYTEENLKMERYIFPELFEEYPFEDLLTLLNLHDAVVEQIKESRRNAVDGYCTDDTENYFWDTEDEDY